MTDHLLVPYDALPDLFEGDLRYHAQRVTACGEYTAAVVLYAVADAIATERATTEGATDAPQEPTGLSAVVRDADGDHWVRTQGGLWLALIPGGGKRTWDDVAMHGPLTVVSEGVES